jgi:spore germination cell wall hydrolase CwlJ-like protein
MKRLVALTDMLAGAAILSLAALFSGAAAARPAPSSFGASDEDCLALAIYYEARSESEVGQRAVAQVVLNRVRDPAYPDDVCGVVFQGHERRTGCQFSFTCDGSMARRPEGRAWIRARDIAASALAGRSDAPVGNATHYHTTAIRPYWAPSLTRVTTIGAHIFYSRPRGNDVRRIPFERIEQVVLRATDDLAGDDGPVTVSIHRGRTAGSR